MSLIFLLFYNFISILQSDILTNCSTNFTPHTGDTILCPNNCNECNIDCSSKAQCKGEIHVYSSAKNTTILCNQETSCEGSNFYFGEYIINEPPSSSIFINNITLNDFNNEVYTNLYLDCSGLSSCKVSKIYIKGNYINGVTINVNGNENAFIDSLLYCEIMDKQQCTLICGDNNNCFGAIFDCVSGQCQCIGNNCIMMDNTINPTLTSLSKKPTYNPTYIPTVIPTHYPTKYPSNVITYNPTYIPTQIPTLIPTQMPTNIPTKIPTYIPTYIPTKINKNYMTNTPSIIPPTIIQTTKNVHQTTTKQATITNVLPTINTTNIHLYPFITQTPTITQTKKILTTKIDNPWIILNTTKIINLTNLPTTTINIYSNNDKSVTFTISILLMLVTVSLGICCLCFLTLIVVGFRHTLFKITEISKSAVMAVAASAKNIQSSNIKSIIIQQTSEGKIEQDTMEKIVLNGFKNKEIEIDNESNIDTIENNKRVVIIDGSTITGSHNLDSQKRIYLVRKQSDSSLTIGSPKYNDKYIKNDNIIDVVMAAHGRSSKIGYV